MKERNFFSFRYFGNAEGFNRDYWARLEKFMRKSVANYDDV
jgi:DNA/RNA endonuclease G (NUC1)